MQSIVFGLGTNPELDAGDALGLSQILAGANRAEAWELGKKIRREAERPEGTPASPVQLDPTEIAILRAMLDDPAAPKSDAVKNLRGQLFRATF